MIAVTANTRVLVCIAPIDFRRGIDGLASACREVLSADPFSGTVFVFRNRRGTSIKLLAYDGQGFWLCQKRLSEGRFCHWPDQHDDPSKREIVAHQLQVLLAGGDAVAARGASAWRPLPPPTPPPAPSPR